MYARKWSAPCINSSRWKWIWSPSIQWKLEYELISVCCKFLKRIAFSSTDYYTGITAFELSDYFFFEMYTSSYVFVITLYTARDNNQKNNFILSVNLFLKKSGLTLFKKSVQLTKKINLLHTLWHISSHTNCVEAVFQSSLATIFLQ